MRGALISAQDLVLRGCYFAHLVPSWVRSLVRKRQHECCSPGLLGQSGQLFVGKTSFANDEQAASIIVLISAARRHRVCAFCFGLMAAISSNNNSR